MVEFIELSDSDSSCDDQNECYYSVNSESPEKPSDADSPVEKSCEERFASKALQDGKPVRFWESFNISKRSFNDDGSVRNSTADSPGQKRAPSRTLQSESDEEEDAVFQRHKSTVQKFNDDSSEQSSLDHPSKKHCAARYSDDEEDPNDFEFSNRKMERNTETSDASQSQDQDMDMDKISDDVALNGDDITKKFGDKNFGCDPNISFSYASSKLFNNLARSKTDFDATTQRIEANRTATTENHDRKNPYSKRKDDADKPVEKRDSISRQVNNSTNAKVDINQDKKMGSNASELLNKHDELNNEVHHLWQRILEVDPDLCKPPSNCDDTLVPIVHRLTKETRPERIRRLIPVSSVFGEPLASFYRSKFHSFNELQSELVPVAANSDECLVVSAPTAAGKTCIFEMALCRLLAQLIGSTGNVAYNTATFEIPNNKKILYIAPNKALCEERYDDWTRRLQSIYPSIEIALVTGDSDSQSFRQIASSHLILTTPEKWDSITRRWTDHFFLIGSVKLLLIDEVHMLGDEQRGACLESLICRMKTVQRAAQSQALSRVKFDELRISSSALEALASKMRIVAVSATLPNIADIASFLDVKEAFFFDESYRPVELKTHVVGLGYKGKNQYLFDRNLDRHVPELLDRFSDGKPSIVFCHSKKDTERLAAEVSSRFTAPNQSLLDEISNKVYSGVLQKCLKRGVAFHHAGMDADNRRIVEQAFSKGLIKCLCATSTLAIGVNLPAHLVIIKGTSAYRGASVGHVDIDIGTILQMIGRSGRPGFDSSGTAVIMTDMKSKSRYEKLSTGLEAVESKLLSQLTETLNTEVSQRVITNIKQAIDWLKGTFFFHCIRRNPGHYGLFKKTEQERESYLMKRCLESLQELHNSRIIKIQDDTMNLSPDDASNVMNHHMVPFEAMKLIIGLAFDSGPLQILRILSKMNGLHFPVRKAEKVLLNEAHKGIKYKLEGPLSKVRIQTSEEKAFVLLQAAIGQIYLEDYTLRQEMSSTVEYAKRILCAIEEFSVVCSKHGTVALESLLLRRSLNTSLWSANDGVLNQIKGVGQKSGRKLADNNIRTFTDVLSHSSDDIEQACGRSSPFGQELRAAVRQIFQNSLNLSAYVDQGNNDHPLLICTLKRLEDIDVSSNGDVRGVVSYTLTVHVDGPGSLLMFREHIGDEGVHSIQIPKTFGRLYIRLVCNIVGMDEQLSIDGTGIITKSMFSVSPKSKSTKTANQDSERNRLQQMDKFVDGVDDIRVHKRKNTTQANTSIVETKPDTVRQDTVRTAQNVAVVKSHGVTPAISSTSTSKRTRKDCEVVTPSPNIPMISVPGRQFQPTGLPSKNPIPAQSHSSWSQNKSEQTKLQRRVFKCDKDNPFASYNCDPNNLERHMEIQSNFRRLAPEEDGRGKHQINNVATGQNVSFSGRFSRVSRPNPLAYALKRKRLGQSSVRLPNQDLLRMKAEEQQAYVSAHANVVDSNSTPSWLLAPSVPNNYQHSYNSFPSNSTGFGRSFTEVNRNDRLHVRPYGNTESNYCSVESGTSTFPMMMHALQAPDAFDDFSTFHDGVPFLDHGPSDDFYPQVRMQGTYNSMQPFSYDNSALQRVLHNPAEINYRSNLNNDYSQYQVDFSNSQRQDRAGLMPTSHLVPTNYTQLNEYSRPQPGYTTTSVNHMSELDGYQVSTGTSFYLQNSDLLHPVSTTIATNPLQTERTNQFHRQDARSHDNQMFDNQFHRQDARSHDNQMFDEAFM